MVYDVEARVNSLPDQSAGDANGAPHDLQDRGLSASASHSPVRALLRQRLDL